MLKMQNEKTENNQYGLKSLTAIIMRHDLISDMLSAIKTNERFGKKSATVKASGMEKELLLLLQKNGYIGSFELIDDGKGGKFEIQLIGKVNACGSVRPRFAVKKENLEKWERRFLPAAGVGLVILSTSKGIMTHIEARQQNIGGKLLAYVY